MNPLRMGHRLWLAAGMLVLGSTAWSAPWLNDTGSWHCVDEAGEFTRDCAGTGQDGEFGRDVTDKSSRDGFRGFRYSKIGADGGRLPADAATWQCVRDEVSGLTWETKRNEPGSRNHFKQARNRGEGRRQDVSNQIVRANQARMCGADDWRLPKLLELQSLLNFGIATGMMIDQSVFVFAGGYSSTWTSTTVAGDPESKWVVNFYVGSVGYRDGFTLAHARLVHGTPVDDSSERYVADGGEVSDPLTGLVWRRCSEGQSWTAGTSCSGAVTRLDWKAALAHAQAETARTGVLWRLPNAKELSSLVDRTRKRPSIDSTLFPNTPSSRYWSSTPYVLDEDSVYMFEFAEGSGSITYTTERLALRLVRDVSAEEAARFGE